MRTFQVFLSAPRSIGPGRAATLAFLLCVTCTSVAQQTPASISHDYRTCETCRKALDKSLGYLKANLNDKVLRGNWYAEFLGAFYAGFAFLMDGNSQKEAEQCAKHLCKYFDWVKRHGGYEGWFCSMAMLYLTEYSLRYGVTPEIAEKLEWGAKWVHKTREREGGWFHGPRWGQGNYALDISSVGCGYFMALEEMRVLGLQTGPALEEAREYVNKVCDGKSVAYGLHGRGGFSLAAASYILLGLTSTGQDDDPRVKGIGNHLKQNFRDIRKAHACGYLHHFAVAAALHRVGPEAYAPFSEYYLHQYVIPNMRPDGTVGNFPNDSSDDPAKAYAALRESSDYVSTAVAVAMILLERPNAFSPMRIKKPGSMSNKDAFKIASEALARGDLARAYKHFAEVLPFGDDDSLVPQAQAEMKKIEEPLKQAVQAAREFDAQGIEKAKMQLDAKEYMSAVLTYEGIVKNYEELVRKYAGMPQVGDAKGRIAELRKIISPLRIQAVYSGQAAGGSGVGPPAVQPNASSGNSPPVDLAAVTGAFAPADAEKTKAAENRLKARVADAIEAGGRPRCTSKLFGVRMVLLSLNERGEMQVELEKGGRVDLRWSQLQPPDLAALAMDLSQSQGTPADHALAAFYLRQQGEREKAEEYLLKVGAEAVELRETLGLK